MTRNTYLFMLVINFLPALARDIAEQPTAEVALYQLKQDLPAWQFFQNLLDRSKEVVARGICDNEHDVNFQINRANTNIATIIATIGASAASTFLVNYGLHYTLPLLFFTGSPIFIGSTFTTYLLTTLLINKTGIARPIITPLKNRGLYSYVKNRWISRLSPCVQLAKNAELLEQKQFAELLLARESLPPEVIASIARILKQLAAHEDSIPELVTTKDVARKALNTLLRPPINSTQSLVNQIQEDRQTRESIASLTFVEQKALKETLSYGFYAADHAYNKRVFDHQGSLQLATLAGAIGGQLLAGATKHLCSVPVRIGWCTAGQLIGGTLAALTTLATRLKKLPFYSLMSRLRCRPIINRFIKTTDTSSTDAFNALKDLTVDQQSTIKKILSFTIKAGYCPPIRFDRKDYYFNKYAAIGARSLMNH
jgi:hypothetical protein